MVVINSNITELNDAEKRKSEVQRRIRGSKLNEIL